MVRFQHFFGRVDAFQGSTIAKLVMAPVSGFTFKAQAFASTTIAWLRVESPAASVVEADAFSGVVAGYVQFIGPDITTFKTRALAELTADTLVSASAAARYETNFAQCALVNGNAAFLFATNMVAEQFGAMQVDGQVHIGSSVSIPVMGGSAFAKIRTPKIAIGTSTSGLDPAGTPAYSFTGPPVSVQASGFLRPDAFQCADAVATMDGWSITPCSSIYGPGTALTDPANADQTFPSVGDTPRVTLDSPLCTDLATFGTATFSCVFDVCSTHTVCGNGVKECTYAPVCCRVTCVCPSPLRARCCGPHSGGGMR